MAKHLASVLWSLRAPGDQTDRSYVKTLSADKVTLVLDRRAVKQMTESGGFIVLDMPRAEARMLARRLTQMLEDTK